MAAVNQLTGDVKFKVVFEYGNRGFCCLTPSSTPFSINFIDNVSMKLLLPSSFFTSALLTVSIIACMTVSSFRMKFVIAACMTPSCVVGFEVALADLEPVSGAFTAVALLLFVLFVMM